MKKILCSTLVLIFLCACPAKAFDDLDPQFVMDFLYHYSRMTRTTSGENINFLAHAGGMLQMEYTHRFNLFTRYYFGGDIAYYDYETDEPTIIDPSELIPFQIYAGLARQFGRLKNFELFFGGGVASEYYQDQQATDNYSMESQTSARVHVGFTYRLLSVVGSVAQLRGRYSYPVTPVTHNDGAVGVNYLGILDGTFRLRFHYDSSWSLFGGIRFEDFTTATNTEYFATRIYAGIGIHL